MALLEQGITMVTFDDSLLLQNQLQALAHDWVDVRDLHHTRRYCDWNSLQMIQQRLKGRTKQGITLLGSGDFHYVSYLLLSEIRQPYTLILFDNHSDMMGEPESNRLFSCGSWVTKALSLPYLQKVFVIGAHPGTFARIPQPLSCKVVYVPYEAVPRESVGLETLDPIRGMGIRAAMEAVLARIPTKGVYLSIDKDVLNRREVITDWDQGQMSLEELLEALHELVLHKEVLGVDICGEWGVHPLDLFHPERRRWISRNQQVNLEILQALTA